MDLVDLIKFPAAESKEDIATLLIYVDYISLSRDSLFNVHNSSLRITLTV